MLRTWLAAVPAILLSLAAALAPAAAMAAEPVLGVPSAEGELGGPFVFSTSITGDAAPARAELLLRQPGERAEVVLPATVSGGSGSWTAAATLEGHVLPNTRLNFRFRIRDPEAGAVVGPAAEVVVADRRFEWRTVSGPIVRLHWYAGDEAFGRRALEVGERAVANAAELLGVTETEPIDFFIYADQDAFLEALGPGTRENIAGQAHSDTRTMFAQIDPTAGAQAVDEVLIVHELTHLVFNTATENVYRRAAHWLNEGVAVYLSEGYSARWQSVLEEGISARQVIPLDSLSRRFPAGDFRFLLGYAEGVSAVDYLVRTYGEPTLWQLVRSYAEGLSDDDAFRRATGADLVAFNAAWMASLGVEVPSVHGPQPGPTGPLPPGWETVSQPTPPPVTPSPEPEVTPLPSGSQPGATGVATPGATGARTPPVGPPGSGDWGQPDATLLAAGVALAAGVVSVVLLAWLWRRDQRRQS
ncbi:MAG: peptidase MA family metallohydrolase [Chloroflexota bacterium]|nr:peptidase MA family metallohydrolase [Chloroflexota bacterium]